MLNTSLSETKLSTPFIKLLSLEDLVQENPLLSKKFMMSSLKEDLGFSWFQKYQLWLYKQEE